ncbi:MAG: transposase family protein [Alphaproteobacteria bacterium]|nr:transposase family protein [Alphaproteobacteria bacterium]
MREWYTNAEFADLNLPGFPNTQRGVLKWFDLRDLDARFPNKVRRRKGRGGGVERHITMLPAEAQRYLTIKHLKIAEAPVMPEPFSGARDIPAPPVGERGELRRDAILLILNFWDIFRSRFSGPVETARHMFVTMYRNGKIDGIPDWVTEALKSENGRVRGACVNTLRSWEEMRSEHMFTELAGNYGNRKGTGVLDAAEDGQVAQRIAAFLVKQPHLTADHIRDLVRDEFGETLEIGGKHKPVPSLRTFERFISTWRQDHQESLMKLTDPDAWKNKKRFSGTNMNHWVSRPNQLWEIDASPADVLLTDGRYSIYAVIDIYTRRMMVTVTKTPKTAAVLALLRRAILAWGVPEILRTDNGSDFISHEFKRALSALAIHQDITDPFSPEQKGTVERAIGTLQRGIMPLLPGFVGHNVSDRKKIEARKSFAQRLGESDEKAFCVELTHEELQAKVDHWLLAKYEHKGHGGLKGKTPFEMIAAWKGPIRTIENERALDVMLAPIAGKDGFRTVTKFGIALDKAHFIHPALVPGDRVFYRAIRQQLRWWKLIFFTSNPVRRTI